MNKRFHETYRQLMQRLGLETPDTDFNRRAKAYALSATKAAETKARARAKRANAPVRKD